MTWLRVLVSKFSGLFRKARLEEQLDDEVRAHLDMLADENLRKGMSPEEAHYAAMRQFGNISRMKEECRDRWSIRLIDEAAQDVRFGLRQLRRNPGFTIIAILTLALGIGANTAIFSVVNGVLLNPLPYHHPGRLVALYSRTEHFSRSSISYPNFLDWVRDNRSFSPLAAYRPYDFDLTGMGVPERVHAEMVSAEFFDVLGVNPVIGRMFLPEDDRLGAAHVVLISGGLWKREFGSSPRVLGKALTLNGVAYTVIGVIPSSFSYSGSNFRRSDVYVPLGNCDDPTFLDRRTSMGMNAVGRLKPGVTFAQAEADMDVLAKHLAEQYPDADKGTGITLVPLKQSIVGSIRPYLLLLLAAVTFVLLIACVNVANLLLARSTGRAREFAIRSALGAGRSRILRQFLTESVLLALAGGGFGLLIASWGLQYGLRLLPEALPRARDIHLDGHVLLFTVVVSVFAGILFGVVPAFKVSETDRQETLKEGWCGPGGTRHRTQSTFVVVEMALTLVLLAGAGLMIRSLVSLWNVDPGFNPRHVLKFNLSFPLQEKTPGAIRATLREIQSEFASIPGVLAAAETAASQPLENYSDMPFWLGGHPKPSTQSKMKRAMFYLVQPDYLKVMRIPLERGRFLTSADNEHSPVVTVIDDHFAHLYFHGKNPIGKHINFAILNLTAEVVGVVGHVTQWGPGSDSTAPVQAQCYLALSQLPDRLIVGFRGDTAVVVRTAGPSLGQLDSISRAARRINGRAVIYGAATMQSILAESTSLHRFAMILLGIFSTLALLMATIGIYGVISYATRQRTHEIGIRMALGAGKSDVLKMVVGQGFRLALVGVAIGIAGALALTRFLSSLLYGVKPTDPITFIAVSVVLIAVALLASYIPARRAAKVDPMVALRYE